MMNYIPVQHQENYNTIRSLPSTEAEIADSEIDPELSED